MQVPVVGFCDGDLLRHAFIVAFCFWSNDCCAAWVRRLTIFGTPA
jgi:hypothetical protein